MLATLVLHLVAYCPVSLWYRFCSVSGACGGHYKFSPGSVLFLRAVWLVGLSAQWCGRVILYGFQILLARWCDCWWMVDGGWAHAFCLFRGRAFWRDFLYCVHW